MTGEFGERRARQSLDKKSTGRGVILIQGEGEGEKGIQGLRRIRAGAHLQKKDRNTRSSSKRESAHGTHGLIFPCRGVY